MIFRPETAGDAAAIRQVVLEAFDGQPHSDGTEHLIVDRLRAAGMLRVSLVAEVDGTIVGHVAFSPVAIEAAKGDWFGLGPVAVSPAYHGKGIGSALVRKGLRAVMELGGTGCVVMGDPAFYGRFGFANRPDLVLKDCAPQYFMALPLFSSEASGMVTYHPAFYGAHDG